VSKKSRRETGEAENRESHRDRTRFFLAKYKSPSEEGSTEAELAMKRRWGEVISWAAQQEPQQAAEVVWEGRTV
jgi:hypothetical protein